MLRKIKHKNIKKSDFNSDTTPFKKSEVVVDVDVVETQIEISKETPTTKKFLGFGTKNLEKKEIGDSQVLVLPNINVTKSIESIQQFLAELPSDSQDRLKGLNANKSIFNCLKPLFLILLGASETAKIENFLDKQLNNSQGKSADTVADISANAQKYSSMYLRLLALHLNRIVSTETMTLEDLKKRKNDYVLVEFDRIDVSDVSNILQAISDIFPELILAKKNSLVCKQRPLGEHIWLDNCPIGTFFFSTLLDADAWSSNINGTPSIRTVHQKGGRVVGSTILQLHKKDSLETIRNLTHHQKNIIRILFGIFQKNNNEEFTLSLRYLLHEIGDLNREITVNNEILTLEKKLKNLFDFLMDLRTIGCMFEYRIDGVDYSPKDYVKADHTGYFELFYLVDDVEFVKEKKDILLRINPGASFKFNHEVLKQYVRIPKKVLHYNKNCTNYYSDIYHYVVSQFRINKKYLKGKLISQMTFNVIKILENTTPKSQIENLRFTRLKRKLLDTLILLEKSHTWKIDITKLKQAKNFKEFEIAEFSVILDADTETSIIGKKTLIPKLTPVNFEVNSEMIKSFREKFNLTQQNLADHLGYALITVKKAEQNDSNISSAFCSAFKEFQRLNS